MRQVQCFWMLQFLINYFSINAIFVYTTQTLGEWFNIGIATEGKQRRAGEDISDIRFILQGERERRPHTHKLYSRVAHIWGDRKGQPNRSAMERPRPGRTA